MFQKNTNKFREPRFFLFLTFLVLIAILIFYFISSMITSVGYQTFLDVKNDLSSSASNNHGKITVFIDAGHGGEDPGAVANGVIEKEINLSVANKLAVYLRLSGYEVILTRSTDRLMYNDGEEDKKKYYDLKNRLKIAESVENAIFISIHMNKYPLESCKGLQTFYSENHAESAKFAQCIQDSSKMLAPENHRQIKPDQGLIFLLKNLKTPAILVECGFLSNQQDAALLSNSVYQDKLSFALCCGVINFLKERQ